MAQTFKIFDGDVEVNGSTGRPKLIGNAVNEDNIANAREKTSQDMRGALSIDRILSGAGAGIAELVGVMQQTGFLSTRVLLQRQINNMFKSLIRLQNKRPAARPDNEKFSKITLFRIVSNPGSKTSFKFRLDVVTEGGGTLTQSGTVTG